MAQCLSKKKHSSVPETNFPESDNFTLKPEHRENENGNCNAAYEVNLLGNMASSSRNIDDFQRLRSKTEGHALELLNQIKSCTEFDKEVLLHTAKQLCSLKNTMISLKKHKHTKALISNYHAPFNKSVETQRRFYSTKKNNKSKNSKLRLCKPTWEEKNQFLQIHYEEDTEIDEANFKKQNSSGTRSWKIEKG